MEAMSSSQEPMSQVLSEAEFSISHPADHVVL